MAPTSLITPHPLPPPNPWTSFLLWTASLSLFSLMLLPLPCSCQNCTQLLLIVTLQDKIRDLTGHGTKQKKSEKEPKKEKDKGKSGKSLATPPGGADETDSTEADLVAILANQLVKEEGKRRSGFRSKNKKGSKNVIKKKISKLCIGVCHWNF